MRNVVVNLVDEYVLLIHPLVLGTGRRLFIDGGAVAALRLVDTKTTTTGVVIAAYRPAEPNAGLSPGTPSGHRPALPVIPQLLPYA